ncbi:hypothetical protein C7E17_26940, partial [Stenotrophomonas maltophilia]
VGLTLEAVGCEAPLGASCKVEVVDGGWVDAEVVGFAGEVGLTLEAVGCEAPLGASCKVEVVDGGWVDAEVV